MAATYAERLRGRTVAPPTQRTACLITYGDGIRRADETPLHTLAGFLHDHVGDLVSDVHLLPMFPWTSDDGFAVVDHRAVNPALGTWADVADLAGEHDLMFDFVANHTSSSSPWFTGLAGRRPGVRRLLRRARPRLRRLARDPAAHHAAVPRLPAPDGTQAWAWTTFGEDQVDVDVRHPATLIELTDVLLGYLARGASAVRLDAIGFLWKESGTTCIHLPQTHAVIKLWRALADHVAPGARLLTETNVPHAENISYFGNGEDEAHLVYQFALPPLVLHSFVAGSTARLSDWAAGVGPVSSTATWFNFLASHDGIGLRATEGILDDAERAALVDRTRAHGGRVSMASRPDGTSAVYELNLSYLDALCTPDEAADAEILAAKALAAHSILFAFLGVPAVYYHSLVGSSPDHEGMESQPHQPPHQPRGPRRRPAGRRAGRGPASARGVHRHAAPARRTPPARGVLPVRHPAGRAPRRPGLRRPTGRRHPRRAGLRHQRDRRDRPAARRVGRDVLTDDRAAPLTLGPWGYAWVRPG